LKAVGLVYFGQASRKTRDQTGSQAMESGASISPTAAVNTVRWSREEVAQILDQSDRCRPDISQRQFARQADIPRSTVQFWVQRREQLGLDPLLARFLESPVGVAFLQRMLLALHLVFEQDSTCGLRKIAHFLELTQLDRVVAASYGAQQAYATGVTEQINEYGRSEQQRLAAQMPARQVTVCEDETFHPEICLVAIEPVSGFIVLEAYRDQRDTQTWNTSLAAALSGVPVTVIQTVSDEASALKAHARDGLGAHHSPDLFHVQQELSRASSCPLAARVRWAENAVGQANEAVATRLAECDACRQQCPDPGAVAALEKQAAAAEQARDLAIALVQTCRQQQEQMRHARLGVSADDHPFDLGSGTPRDAADAERLLAARFDEIERLAAESGLSESSLARIAKARRVLPGLVATIAFFWQMVWSWVNRLSLPAEIEKSLIHDCLAGTYLRLAAAKAPTAERRRILRELAEQCLSRARDGPMSQLPLAERAELERLAVEWANLFQRSSSCVEGRNGQLSLCHHSLHRLRPKRLAALTVLANYFHRRRDGSTAAERFFGAPPSDLFEWLVSHVSSPPRPAARRQAA
jgi:DNA-binding transcriptional regulator YiaG